MKESAKRIDVEVEVSDGHYPGTYYTDIGIRVRQRRTDLVGECCSGFRPLMGLSPYSFAFGRTESTFRSLGFHQNTRRESVVIPGVYSPLFSAECVVRQNQTSV